MAVAWLVHECVGDLKGLDHGHFRGLAGFGTDKGGGVPKSLNLDRRHMFTEWPFISHIPISTRKRKLLRPTKDPLYFKRSITHWVKTLDAQ